MIYKYNDKYILSYKLYLHIIHILCYHINNRFFKLPGAGGRLGGGEGQEEISQNKFEILPFRLEKKKEKQYFRENVTGLSLLSI